ncbi:MAG: histidine kinase [Butyrivibrio sp.]|nr:histidine kinase [Butyrivibrio sp.]
MKHIISQSEQSKKKSFIDTITISVTAYIILMIVILSFIFVNTSSTLEDNAHATLEQLEKIFNYEIEEILNANEQALATLLLDNENIRTFEYGNDIQRAVASQNMINNLKNIALSSKDIKTLFFYDLINETYLANFEEGISYKGQKEIEEYIGILNEEFPDNMPSTWFCRKIGDHNYLLRLYKNKKRMIGALVDVSDLFYLAMDNDSALYTITDADFNIIEQFGNDVHLKEGAVSEIFLETAGWTSDKSHFILGETSEKGDFNTFVSMRREDVLGSFRLLQIVIILLNLFAILYIVGIVLYTRSVFYKPFTELLNAMKKISNGDQDQRLSAEATTQEFEKINTSFNQMMDTIVNLKMKSYEERIQFDEATLKYVQLQIRPHFFLNALTTIHSMSYQNRDEDIREYIERLSRNVRYLFKSGLHTVSLSEEIEHARDYMGMQDILYPNCVFEFIDIEDGLQDYPVPQLIVHTILENIYKHTVSVDKLTSILISAKIEEKDGAKMCHIAIEDDGVGYPKEFLEQVRAGEVKVKENGHGIGLWNLKKTLELMYRRDDLIYFSNKEPEGSRTDIWIPKRVKRQSSVWKL